MKIRVNVLRRMIAEALTDDVGGPTLEWQEWLGLFEHAVEAAGYEVQSDMPVYDFVASQGADAELIDAAIHQMWKEGIDPIDAVDKMEDRDAFWQTYVSRGSVRSRG